MSWSLLFLSMTMCTTPGGELGEEGQKNVGEKKGTTLKGRRGKKNAFVFELDRSKFTVTFRNFFIITPPT